MHLHIGEIICISWHRYNVVSMQYAPNASCQIDMLNFKWSDEERRRKFLQRWFVFIDAICKFYSFVSYLSHLLSSLTTFCKQMLMLKLGFHRNSELIKL